MHTSYGRLAVTAVASILIGSTPIGPMGGVAEAQQERVRVVIDTPGIVPTIRSNRPVVSGAAIDVPGLNRNTQGLIGPMEEMEGSGGMGMGMDRTQALSGSDDGRSNIFFIRHVPEGTTQFFPLSRPGVAQVDTWTEQVIEGKIPENAPRSPMTIWTGTVHGDGPAEP